MFIDWYCFGWHKLSEPIHSDEDDFSDSSRDHRQSVKAIRDTLDNGGSVNARPPWVD